MPAYHLSYDVKDSGKTNNDEFLNRITEEILKSLSPQWIYRPVASTIYFACAYGINMVKSSLVKILEKDAYYLLTEVKVIEDRPVRIRQGDPSLEKNFFEECKQIKEKNSKMSSSS